MKEKIIEWLIWFIVILFIIAYWIGNNNYSADSQKTFAYIQKIKDAPKACNKFYSEMYVRSNALTNLIFATDKDSDLMAWKCVKEIIKTTKIDIFGTWSSQIFTTMFFAVVTNSFTDSEIKENFGSWFIKDDFIDAWKIWSKNNPETYNKCYEITLSFIKKLPISESEMNICWNKVMESILIQKLGFKSRFY